jgi:hypothetical protein
MQVGKAISIHFIGALVPHGRNGRDIEDKDLISSNKNWIPVVQSAIRHFSSDLSEPHKQI